MADTDVDTSKYAGTVIGPDGKRYPAGEAPAAVLAPDLTFVYGTPGPGKVPVWNATEARWEFGDAGGGTPAAQARLITFTLDGAGAPLTTGTKPKADLRVPFSGVITRWNLAAPSEAGSIVLDVWKDVQANWPPTVADSITGTEQPTLSDAQQAESLTLTGWNTAVTAGDVFRLSVVSVTAITYAVLDLWMVPS